MELVLEDMKTKTGAAKKKYVSKPPKKERFPLPEHQYGGDGTYHLLSFGKRVNRLPMTAKDARERNAARKAKGIESIWWWTGK